MRPIVPRASRVVRSPLVLVTLVAALATSTSACHRGPAAADASVSSDDEGPAPANDVSAASTAGRDVPAAAASRPEPAAASAPG